MDAELNHDSKLEIAHVLFVDIVGYSKCATDEQTELLQDLNDVVRRSAQMEAANLSGELIRLPTGDGMALIFRSSLEAPVRCAIEISLALTQQPDLHVHMGIHSGPVNVVVDVNGRPNVTGAGVNMAQRVMDCGEAGHILL